MKQITIENKKAWFDYEIIDKFEAGVVLTGMEIKAIRAGKMNLAGSYGRFFWHNKGKPELWLVGAHIGIIEGDPTRSRKLLLHRNEIDNMTGKVQEKGLTAVPLKLYFKKGIAKIEIAVAKGKKIYDKREKLKEKDLERERRNRMKKF